MDHHPPDDDGRRGAIQKQLQIFRDDKGDDLSIPSAGANAGGVPVGRRRKPGGEGSSQGLALRESRLAAGFEDPDRSDAPTGSRSRDGAEWQQNDRRPYPNSCGVLPREGGGRRGA